MINLLDYVGTLVKDVVLSDNKRDVDICHDNNTTKIEIGKLAWSDFQSKYLERQQGTDLYFQQK